MNMATQTVCSFQPGPALGQGGRGGRPGPTEPRGAKSKIAKVYAVQQRRRSFYGGVITAGRVFFSYNRLDTGGRSFMLRQELGPFLYWFS
jgi:hypothetical protein